MKDEKQVCTSLSARLRLADMASLALQSIQIYQMSIINALNIFVESRKMLAEFLVLTMREVFKCHFEIEALEAVITLTRCLGYQRCIPSLAFFRAYAQYLTTSDRRLLQMKRLLITPIFLLYSAKERW